MLYSYVIEDLTVRTGDIICTTDGSGTDFLGHVWSVAGRLVPGEVDHVAMYVGPEGQCVEAGPAGVVRYQMPGHRWDPEAVKLARRLLIDRLYGVAYPLAERGLPATTEDAIRRAVADYCLAQATSDKPYNLNFLDVQTENAFYCSQLIYQAYLHHGIDLSQRETPSPAGGAVRIILPQEIWNACVHRRAEYPSREEGSAAAGDL